jgi:translation initiation factor 2B subunit (eIF-2B alpha/beta/delta family)
VYFEWVPSDLINYYINEYGVTDSAGILRYAEEVAKEADQYFTNL